MMISSSYDRKKTWRFSVAPEDLGEEESIPLVWTKNPILGSADTLAYISMKSNLIKALASDYGYGKASHAWQPSVATK
jgi:hypothetical protein